MNEELRLTPIGEVWGDLFTVEEFIDLCEMGGFVDYDGVGDYATATHVSNISVWPSKILKEGALEGWTHVMWYNK